MAEFKMADALCCWRINIDKFKSWDSNLCGKHRWAQFIVPWFCPSNIKITCTTLLFLMHFSIQGDSPNCTFNYFGSAHFFLCLIMTHNLWALRDMVGNFVLFQHETSSRLKRSLTRLSLFEGWNCIYFKGSRQMGTVRRNLGSWCTPLNIQIWNCVYHSSCLEQVHFKKLAAQVGPIFYTAFCP